jgi:hypothetical protein
MSNDLSKYLADPKPGMTLDELARDLNELAKIRDNARVAFCKRLAVAYLMIVGHVPSRGPSEGARKFYQWCDRKISAANGKRYTHHTLRRYMCVGFAKNPERTLREKNNQSNRTAKEGRDIAIAVRSAVATATPPKVIPITRLKKQGLPTDVATEVNRLMTAWEQASSQARSQFMYLVTGKRIAA